MTFLLLLLYFLAKRWFRKNLGSICGKASKDRCTSGSYACIRVATNAIHKRVCHFIDPSSNSAMAIAEACIAEVCERR